MTSRSGGISSAGIGLSSPCEADGRGVDEDLRLGQLGLDDRLVPGHRPQLHVGRAPAEEADERLRPVQVAVEDDDPLEALRDEAVDDGPRAAAGAQDHGRAGHLLLARPASSRATRKPGTSVLWPTSRLPSLVIVLTAPGRVRLLGQAIDERRPPSPCGGW